jgi:hypothetical protein
MKTASTLLQITALGAPRLSRFHDFYVNHFADPGHRTIDTERRTTTMKTASTLLQSLALSACLAACLGGSDEARMPGVRKALQTMSGSASQTSFPEFRVAGTTLAGVAAA